MPRYVDLRWEADALAPGPRSRRAGFRYRAFVPDSLSGRSLTFDAAVAARIGVAERAIAELNRNPPLLGPLEALARRLLRAESVASSRIEGLELSQRRLARAEVVGDDARDETARDVLANIAAMEKAIELSTARRGLKPRDLDAIHAVLMHGVSDAGSIRTQQNWIGGNSYNPHAAAFVPPPPELVGGLLDDLCVFLQREDVSPLAQAAIAHAQFETIHPYVDGNGRVGRALMHAVLRRRGLAPRYVPPISLVLAGNSGSYIEGLIQFREGGLERWCGFFADTAQVAAARSVVLAERFRTLQADWLARAGRPRADSSAAALIGVLPAYPILSVATAQALTGRSKQAANEAVSALEAAGILSQVSVGKRNRAWEAKEVFDLLNVFERELATPDDGAAPAARAPPRGRGQSKHRG